MFYSPYYMFDPTYILIIIGVLLSLWASARVNSTFQRYDKVRSQRGLTGAEAAERILRANGIYDVTIQRINGRLTDCYVPSKKALYLSDSTYNSTSIAAIGVAAHECGHAIQYATDYSFISISNALHPVSQIGSNLAVPILMLGLILSADPLVTAGILLFGLGVLLSIVTLPVEYNASNRALAILDESGMMSTEELAGTKKVLRAAGLTYVAAATQMVLTLLRLVLISRRNQD